MKELTREIVTLWYRSPDLILGEKNYDVGADMWSVGCILAEFVTRKPIFMGDSQIDQLFKIFQLTGTPDEELWPDIVKYTDFKPTFPKFKPSNMLESEIFDIIGEQGKNLIKLLL